MRGAHLLFARIEASRARAAEVRPEHLLIGWLVAPRSRLGRLVPVPIDVLRRELGVPAAASSASAPASLSPSVDVQAVIERAQDEARQLQQQLQAEHLLLALFSDETCARVLTAHGLSADSIRDRLIERAQAPVRFTVHRSPDADLVFTPYDRQAHGEFAYMLTQQPFEAHASHAAVLTNRSTRQVTALVLLWAFGPGWGGADQDGGAGRLFRDQSVHVPPSREHCAGDARRLHGTGGPRWWMVGRRDGPNPPELGAVAITVSLDSAILDDGQIVGPDTYDIARYLHERDVQVQEVRSELQAASDKEARDAVRRQLVEDGRRPFDRARPWRHQLGLMMRHGADLTQQMERMRPLPRLRLRRRTTSPTPLDSNSVSRMSSLSINGSPSAGAD